MTINLIRVYKWDDCWWFDDAEKGIVKEELVMGSPEFIEDFIVGTRNVSEFDLMFGDGMTDYDFMLTFVRFEEAGYVYRWDSNEMWLCSVLNRYYDLAPEKIYLKCV